MEKLSLLCTVSVYYLRSVALLCAHKVKKFKINTKKNTMKNLIIIIFAIFFTVTLNSQWLEELRLTNNSSSSHQPSVASIEQYVYVVWQDYRDGNDEIYYKRSTNHGANWSGDVRLTNQTNYSRFPEITVSGGKVFVVWTDERNGTGHSEIYLKRSTDFGATWSDDIRISNNSGSSNKPSISNNGDLICIAWEDNRDGNTEIYTRRSPDGGVSWGSETRISNNSSNSQEASISVSGQNVFLAWSDNRNGSIFEIYYVRSLDGGLSWGSENRFTNNSTISNNSSVSNSGQTVIIGWGELAGFTSKNYYKKSTDNGANWSPEYQLSSNSNTSFAPQVIITSTNLVHSVWPDERNGVIEVFYKSSFDSIYNWSTDLRLNTVASLTPDICYSDTNVHVVWADNRNSNFEIYYKRNPVGNPIGIQQVSSQVPSGFSLSQNYPNPFNPATNIKISVPKSEFVRLSVYDVTGKEVAALVNEKLSAGVYNVDFNASELSSGVYFYRLTSGSFTDVKKMMLVK